MDEPKSDQVFNNTVAFLKQLTAAGMQHVVISPGSRSTPLTLAAATLPQLKKHIILDERSAAFLALGIAKAQNKPAALICTSGTAVANYLPAVIEASKSGVPLLLLTADRPERLQGTGTNQTINQKNVYGTYAVHFEQMLEPFENYSLPKLKKLASNFYLHAIRHRGSVHINFPFDKPLEPSPVFLKQIIDENEKLAEAPAVNKEKDLFRFDEAILRAIQVSERPLFIVGQLTPAANPETIFKLAGQLNAPVLTEQGTSNNKISIQSFEGFLRPEINQHKLEPDLILRFGLQPASKSLLEAIKKWSPENHIYFVEGNLRSDIEDTASKCVQWDGTIFELDVIIKKDTTWLAQWKKVEKYFQTAIGKNIKATGELTDGHIYHHLSPKIPEDWFVFVANSFPARDQSLFARWKTQKLFSNRGASGIDGITSTAMGINIGLNNPGILFVGDLSFLHDTNALLNHKKLKHPLVIVVINNRGGSLFRMLPIADFKDQFTPYFETPQSVDIAKLADAYQIDCTCVNNVDELNTINLQKLVKHSDSKLHIIECQTNADASMDLRNKLWRVEL